MHARMQQPDLNAMHAEVFQWSGSAICCHLRMFCRACW